MSDTVSSPNLEGPQANKPLHTPGPWVLDGRNIRSTVDRPYWQPDGIKLAEVITGAIGSDAARANGAVMTTAPELLAVLKSVRAALNCRYDSAVIESEYGAAIDAAIAKAGGRQP